MSDYERALIEIAERRLHRNRADERLHATRRRLSAAAAALDAARRGGEAGSIERLEADVRRLEEIAASDLRRLDDRTRGLASSLEGLRGLAEPTELIEQWDDRTPILLLPVRVETRFMPVQAPTELWVRVFPDDIAVDTHETGLTAAETAAGESYWADVAAAATLPDGERRARTTAAWQALSSGDTRRAAWIAVQTRPTISSEEQQQGEDFWTAFLGASGSDAAEGLWQALAERHGPTRARLIALRTAPAAAAAATVAGLVDEAGGEAWGRAPRSRVMPDRFAVVLQAPGRPDRTEIGNQIPDPLVLGPDPSSPTLDIDQVDGAIRLSNDLRWMHDFDEAVRIGMALRIPLSSQEAAAGFDRLFVVGLRLSSDVDQSRTLVERLIDAHRYSAAGAALVPQGTPTNNTAEASAGFDSAAARPEDTEALEIGPPLFVASDDPASRADAQWLAEMLGIDFAPLQHLQHADRRDVNEARLMNQALWPATLGYYLEQMLGLGAPVVREIERFFVQHVSGRGPLPAIRIGAQPYGVLLTSDFSRWRAPAVGSSAAAQLVLDVSTRLDPIWESAAGQVSFAGKPGDAHAHLLNILGLHATSVDYFRRHAFGSAFLWNYATFLGWGAAAGNVHDARVQAARRLLAELGWPVTAAPPIVNLTFFNSHWHITDPLIDDVPEGEEERWSEQQGVRRLYLLPGVEGARNYLAWLHAVPVAEIKTQAFRGVEGQELPAPRPLLYRLLRHALLLANVDAALQLYERHGVVSELARREDELPNVRAGRTVTRWELLEARVDRVLPQVSGRPLAVVDYLATEEGEREPAVSNLLLVRAALESLADLPTARLERLLAEHLDVCSYRLDAWQTALFAERIRLLRDPSGSGRVADRALGLRLGAFGWLENVRQGQAPALVDPQLVPDLLRGEDGSAIVEQPDSGGVIHTLSPAHAVAAAVLRNAYLTHASPEAPTPMSVELSSSRVRLAARYIEGIGGGASLGALLGYQFSRGLKDRHGDPSLAQFIPNFRDAYPVRADKITPDAEGSDAALKESAPVFDGYALLERTLLADPPIGYPFGVSGLPDAASPAAASIRDEVERMAAAMDAVGDLALAEGVFQVAQGNFDRAGAMMQAISRGLQPPEPEIPRTPRSGVAINHRVALHFDADADDHVWSEGPTPRSSAEPALNAWLAERLGDPATIRFLVKHGADLVEDPESSIADLDLEPIDLISLVGDELPGAESELVRRIRHAYRGEHGGHDNPALERIVVEFPARHVAWGPGDRSFFEIWPLLTALKRLASSVRPLGAGDYMLPSEETTDPAVDPNPQRHDAGEMDARLDTVVVALLAAETTVAQAAAQMAGTDLATATAAQRAAALSGLVGAIGRLAAFGIPDAFLDGRPAPPHAGEAPTPFERAMSLHLERAASLGRRVAARRAEAARLKDFTDLTAAEIATLTTPQKVERYRDAARQLLGADFNLLPRFTFKNVDELAQAASFGSDPGGLLRHFEDPLPVEEWFQGAASVRERLQLLETIMTMGDAVASPFRPLRPLQLPFRAKDFWVALEYPSPGPDGSDTPGFVPAGDFLSIVHQVSPGGFAPAAPQTGVLLDAWSEVIPNAVETTGIAVHYDQPSAHPPQALLLAVAPELSGAWTWDRLLGVLADTLRRTRLRAVEPDHIDATALAQLLPAVMTPVASRPDVTISADLVHATSVAFADRTV